MTLRDCWEAVLATENYYRFIEDDQAWDGEDFFANVSAERLASAARLDWYATPVPHPEMLVGAITLLSQHSDDRPAVIYIWLVA